MGHATLAFVRGEQGERHRVWITPDGREAVGLDLHVRHDLPHLAVESVLGIEDGLWGALVAHGQYPGLTDAHVVAKSLTNAIVGAVRIGDVSADGVRAALLSFVRPERAGRDSFDGAVAERWASLVAARVARLDDASVSAAAERLRWLLERWSQTGAGEVLRLEWPLGEVA
jgi:hypothetical protein